MPKKKAPRSGSMQFWPRKRAKRSYARVRSWPAAKDATLLGYAGYKVGMTHLMVKDNGPRSRTKGETIAVPATIIECPPIRPLAVRFYTDTPYGRTLAAEVALKAEKELSRKISLPKKQGKTLEGMEGGLEGIDDITLVVHTQPKLTGIGKKRPDVFEIGIGGATAGDKLAYAKSVAAKEIMVGDLFRPGEQLDIHAVTKGKGTAGPVKRFGIGLKAHKSEKGQRRPGSLGPWKAQGHVMYRVAMAGKMGYSQRTEYNKWLLGIETDPAKLNVAGGHINYGIVKNPCIIVKGSVAGPKKRIIRFTKPMRPNRQIPSQPPEILTISISSKQGN
ncbi:50S ribosomal protein L3 [Candidatus Woesearchaeota archaeon]|nr:50S ribosomal protein L3 [Candidatus Woesearchaeota archaeon]